MRFSATAILSLTTSFGGLLATASCSQQTNAATIVSSTDGVVVRNSIPHSQKYVKESFGRSAATNKKDKDNTTKTAKNIPQDDRIGNASAGRGHRDHRHNVRYSNEGILKNPTFDDQSNAVLLGEQPPSADVGILSVDFATTTTVSHDTTTTSSISTPNRIKTEKHHIQTSTRLLETGCTDMLSCDASFTDPCTNKGSFVVINDGSCNGDVACQNTAAASNAVVDISCYSCNGNSACINLAQDADDSATFTINNSCVQKNSCNNLGSSAGASSNFILNYSCEGRYACLEVGKSCNDNVYFLIENSCNGRLACPYLGEFAGDGSTFVINNNSCSSCGRMGQNAGAGSSFQVDSYSCNTGNGDCSGFARYASNGSSFHIHSRSCQGRSSCYNLGRNAPENANFEIGSNSCIGYYACSDLGKYSQELYIGDGSCLGDYSCYGQNRIDGDKTLPIHIGIGSCTCDNCCKNLQPGSYIGNGRCVSETEQCENFDGPVVRQEFTEQSCSFPQASPDHETILITDTIVFNEESICDEIEDIFVNVILIGTETSDDIRVVLTHVLSGEETADAPQVELFSASNYMCNDVDPVWGSPSILAKFFLQHDTASSIAGSETCPETDIIFGDFAVADMSNFQGRSSSGEWILTVEGAESQVILTSWEIGIACASPAVVVEEEFACAARDNTACAFSENPNEQFTSFCVLHNNDHFDTDCKRHDINDEISEIGVGMFLSSDKLVVGCGCCDPDLLTVEAYGSAANDVRGTDKSFCVASEPLCTPEEDGDGWDPCDTSGKGKVRKINVCVDGMTQCIDPFSVFVGGETVTCGVCPDSM